MNIQGDFYALIVIRALMGLCQGPLNPALMQLMSAWIPVTELAFAAAIIFSGINVKYFVQHILNHFNDNHYQSSHEK